MNSGWNYHESNLGSALIRDSDLVIVDDDGVVVWPQKNIEQFLEKAREMLDKDNARLAGLLAQVKNKETQDDR